MALLAEVFLFALPFLAYILWRRSNPSIEPGSGLVLAAALGLVCALAGMLWYGFSRSLEAGVYVPPHMEDGRLVPGRTLPQATPPGTPSGR